MNCIYSICNWPFGNNFKTNWRFPRLLTLHLVLCTSLLAQEPEQEEQWHRNNKFLVLVVSQPPNKWYNVASGNIGFYCGNTASHSLQGMPRMFWEEPIQRGNGINMDV